MPLYIMLHMMLAYLILFTALSNAVCWHNAFFLLLILKMLFVFMLCLGLLTHNLFIPSMIFQMIFKTMSLHPYFIIFILKLLINTFQCLYEQKVLKSKILNNTLILKCYFL